MAKSTTLPAEGLTGRMLIDGALEQAHNGTFDSYNPATGAVIGTVPEASVEEVDRAVRAAAEAFKGWHALGAFKREELLIGLADLIREDLEYYAHLDAIDGGLPMTTAINDIKGAIARIEYCARMSREIKGYTYPRTLESFTYSLQQPYGVVGVVTPFNHPTMFVLTKIAAPLAMGNTAVVKPPEQASLGPLALGEALSKALPAGVVNIVTGGRAAGQALTEHPLVNKISFTGSVPTGRAILRAAAERIVPALIELGGKNATIVLPDANLDTAVPGSIDGMSLPVCGQSCQSGTRLFLHDSIHDEFLDRLVAQLGEVRIGDPLNHDTQMGPLVSPEQYERVTRYVEIGKQEGAKLATGGTRPEGLPSKLSGGNFITPAVFYDVNTSMTIAREEIFGPVLSVLRWSDEDTMLEQVNSVSYGLTASIWSESLGIHTLASKVEAGYVHLNQHGGNKGGPLGTPRNPWKQSGFGVERSLEELLEFVRIKTVDLLM